MSDETTVKWTCDRCGATTVEPQAQQPRDWHRISSANPPRHAEPANVGDVCNGCWTEFCEWWRIETMAGILYPAAVTEGQEDQHG